ncbi:MAG: antiviral reverse transcriptase Drt5 [Acidobacteriaceae bacterium]
MMRDIKNSQQFYLWDHESTLFPLFTNRLLVDRFSSQLREFIREEVLGNDAGFQAQHRVFASKRGWFLRPTVKLDPVADFFLYDFVYRNRSIFRRSPNPQRTIYGFRIARGLPIPLLSSYTSFRKGIAGHRKSLAAHAHFDVAAYFNHIYHHDLVRWFEDAGGSPEDRDVFGRFLREIVSGRSVDCLPQGLYPAKMIGSAFLGFLENSIRIKSAQTLRLMDDMWLFDAEPKTLISDFITIQGLLSERGLAMNDAKSAILEEFDPEHDLPPNLDEMKIQLLRKRREELSSGGFYVDESEEFESEDEDPESLGHLTDEEQQYLVTLLNRDEIQEEDAELVLTLMRDHSADVLQFLPSLIRDFPGLAKRLYYFCAKVQDKAELLSTLLHYVKDEDAKITEFQLFWFAKMAEDYLLKSPGVGDLLSSIYEHEDATDITRAKVLEIPEKRFGLPDIREERLKTGHSDWLAWAAAVGSRATPKGQRNQLLKYFRKSSPMNRLIGEFVETCF